MCKEHSIYRIDKCMNSMLEMINHIKQPNFIVLACCCGHGKYPMTIIVKDIEIKENSIYANTFDLISGKPIRRKKRFYIKDKQGYYYIPETLKS